MLLTIAVGLCGVLAACSSSTPTTPTTPTVTVSSVAIAGQLALTAVGQTSQLTAAATLSNGTSQTVTSQATWQSSNVAVATVSSAGLVSAVGYGTATITATDQGVNGTGVMTIALNVNGTWVGTGTDSIGAEQFSSVVLTQTGSTVAGTFSAVSGGVPVTGTFSGTIGNSGSTLNFTLAGVYTSAGKTCSLSFTGAGQVNNITFTAQYAATSSCGAPITNGQMVLTRQ